MAANLAFGSVELLLNDDTKAACDALFSALDTNGDGLVTFDDFVQDREGVLRGLCPVDVHAPGFELCRCLCEVGIEVGQRVCLRITRPVLPSIVLDFRERTHSVSVEGPGGRPHGRAYGWCVTQTTRRGLAIVAGS